MMDWFLALGVLALAGLVAAWPFIVAGALGSMRTCRECRDWVVWENDGRGTCQCGTFRYVDDRRVIEAP